MCAKIKLFKFTFFCLRALKANPRVCDQNFKLVNFAVVMLDQKNIFIVDLSIK